MNQYFVLVILWFFYGLIHSVLASKKIKNIVSVAYYRLVYNFIAIVLFMGLLVYQWRLPKDQLWQANMLSQAVGAALFLLGLWVLAKAFSGYDLSEFSGFDAFQKDKNKVLVFKNEGILKIVRHPIYTGTILVVIGLFVYDGLLRSLITACCAIFYIRVGIYFEEQKLIAEFGETYKKYQQKVPMLFPKFNSEP